MTKGCIIKTRRLRLRPWRSADVSAYDDHCNTDQVMKFLGGVTTRRQVRAEVLWFQQHEAEYGYTFWALERVYDRALLGFCGVIRIPDRHSIIRDELEIGWRVRADKWRMGYGFEAASAVVEWASWELDDSVLYARIDPANTASRNLASRLGMRRSRKLEALGRKTEPGLCFYRRRL